MNSRKLGKEYEILGKEYLIDNGIRIIDTNYQGAYGEIDIIGYDKNTLVFFEVKYRKNSNFGMPIEAIDRNKMKKIYLTATEFVKKNRLENEMIRFDAVAFLGNDIQWIKNIFWGDEHGI